MLVTTRTRYTGFRRTVSFLIAAATIYSLLSWSGLLYHFRRPKAVSITSDSDLNLQPHLPHGLFNSLSLGNDECETSFPNLTKDVHQHVALGPFDLKAVGDGGPLQVRISNQKLFVIPRKGSKRLSPELLDAQTAALHQLNRALVTSPEPLPDTIISLNIWDQPFGTAFSYSRPAFAPPTSSIPPITRAFLMPHFSFWAWPLPFIGSVARAAAAIDEIEGSLPFRAKDPRVVWRGTPGWNSAHYPDLRKELLRVTDGAGWADVQALGSIAREKGDVAVENAMMVEDFCRYKYVLYTEGITYSGRLQFHQMCRSVLIAPPIAWLQHTTHLVRPLFSADVVDGGWEPPAAARTAWPGGYRPEEANAVFVAPDWSDLKLVVDWLETNPDVAKGIATRQRELFVGKGYLSPASEVCYWRALIRGWSEVVRIDDGSFPREEDVSWELFSLGNETK